MKRSSENQTDVVGSRTMILLWLPGLWSSENCIVGVACRSGRINQSQCSIPDLAVCWFFRFSFRLRQSSFYWIVSDGVVNGIGRNGNVLILATSIPSSLWLTTPIFDFHWVIRFLTTPSLVEINLKEMRFFIKSYFENKVVHSFCEIILFSKNYEFSMWFFQNLNFYKWRKIYA